MAKCEFCDKGVVFGIQVSHSHRRSNRPWKPNVKRVKAIVNGTPKHVYVCTHCLRSGKVTRAVWSDNRADEKHRPLACAFSFSGKGNTVSCQDLGRYAIIAAKQLS